MTDIGMRKETGSSYDEVLGKLPDLLKAEGFGILTRIDVKQTMKEKLGVDFRRYTILGACNPPLAHQALSAEIEIGVMLPCNVIVYEDDRGKAVVTAVDPSQTVAAAHPGLAGVAREVQQRLSRVLEKV